MSEESQSKPPEQAEEHAHKEWQGIKYRIDRLRDLELEYNDLRLEFRGLERMQEAIKYGHIAAGLEGANEKAREAYLREALSEDATYVQAIVRSEELDATLGRLAAELTYQRRLYSLDLLTVFGPPSVGVGIEIIAEQQ